MHNHDIIFDNDNKRIGLVSSNCEMSKGLIENQDDDQNVDNNNNNLVPNDANKTNCSDEISFLRNVCIAVTIIMIIIIGVLMYIISELRRNGKFLWISLNDDLERSNNNRDRDVRIEIS